MSHGTREQKEYKIVNFRRDDRTLEMALNHYAARGWQLHSILDLKEQPYLCLVFECEKGRAS